VLATASSAVAARVVTGAQVVDGSLTGVDVRRASITAADLSSTTRTMMRGRAGLVGATGATGPKGETGPVGLQGAPGTPARVASGWSWFDSRYLATPGNNAGPDNWYAYNGASPGGNVTLPNLQWTNALDRSFETVLSLTSPNCTTGDVQGVDCPWGASDGGGVSVAWDSNITAVATVTFLHNQDADITAGDPPPHTRAQCFLAANKGTGSSDFDQIGAKADVSGYAQRQVETMTLVGSINRTTSSATEYMVRVECRDADGTNGRSRWYVVSGSLNVTATERG
jgi:hypothetical protein